MAISAAALKFYLVLEVCLGSYICLEKTYFSMLKSQYKPFHSGQYSLYVREKWWWWWWWWWMMMINCFSGMVDRQKAFSLVSSRVHCQRSSPSRIRNHAASRIEPAQNMSSRFVEWSCAGSDNHYPTTPRIAVEKKWINWCWENHGRLQQNYWLVQANFSLSKSKEI